MADEEYSARVRELAYKLERSASDGERIRAVEEFLESSENIPSDVLQEIKEELVDDIKNGLESDAYEEIREIIEEEIEEEVENRNSWILVRDKAIDHAIRSAISSLSFLMEIVRQNNSLASADGILSPIQREQIIAVLRAAIAELEAPYIDKGRMSKLRDWLLAIGKRSAERKLSGEITEGFDRAQNQLGELLEKTRDFGPGSPF